jgi:hypothetical protein
MRELRSLETWHSPKLTYLASPIVFALKEQAQAKISLGLPLDDDALQDLIVQRLATVLPLVDPSAIVDEIQALKAAGALAPSSRRL